MSPVFFQDVRCPVCSHLLFRAFGISAHLVIQIKCTCKRLVEVKEGFNAEIIQVH